MIVAPVVDSRFVKHLPVTLYIASKSAITLIVIIFLPAFRQLFTAYNSSITWLFCPIFEICDEPT